MNDLKIKVSDIQAAHEEGNFFRAIGVSDEDCISEAVKSMAVRSGTARTQDLLDSIAEVAVDGEISLAQLMAVCVFHGRADTALVVARREIRRIADGSSGLLF